MSYMYTHTNNIIYLMFYTLKTIVWSWETLWKSYRHNRNKHMIGVSGIAIKFSLGLIDQVEKIRNFFFKKNSSYIYKKKNSHYLR
jgi:hypothetical protein